MVLAMLIALGAAAPDTPVAAAPADKDPIVCHRANADVGSHMRPEPVCMHKSDWDFVEKTTQRELRKFGEHWLDPGKAGGGAASPASGAAARGGGTPPGSIPPR